MPASDEASRASPAYAGSMVAAPRSVRLLVQLQRVLGLVPEARGRALPALLDDRSDHLGCLVGAHRPGREDAATVVLACNPADQHRPRVLRELQEGLAGDVFHFRWSLLLRRLRRGSLCGGGGRESE